MDQYSTSESVAEAFTPTISVHPVFEVTPTPITGIPEDVKDINDYATWLFEFDNQNGCKPPCWWGLIPEQAREEEVEDLISPLGPTMYPSFARGFDVYEAYFRESALGRFAYYAWVKDMVFKGFSVHFSPGPSNWSAYENLGIDVDLPDVLALNGLPEEIMLSLHSTAIDPGVGNVAIYQLLLVYERRGLLYYYEGDYKLPSVADEEIQFCLVPEKYQIMSIYAFSTSEEPSILEFADRFYSGGESLRSRIDRRRIQEWTSVTNLTYSQFSETIKANGCFSSAIEHWDGASP